MKQFSVVLILLIFQAALCCIVSAQEEELLLKFDEGNGKAIDSSGKGHDGRLVAFSGEIWVEGRFGGGLNFGGAGEIDRVVISLFDAMPTENFTAEAWIYPTSLPEPGAPPTAIDNIFDHVRGGTDGWDLVLKALDGGVVPVFRVKAKAGWVSAKGKTALEVNKWYNIASVCDNGTLTVYLNGEEEDSAAYQTPRIKNKRPLLLGGYQQRPPERGFKGIMDNVRYSAVAKSKKQLAYNRWKDVSPLSLLTTCWAKLKKN